MARQAEKAFLEIWPKCFLKFLAIVELIAVIILFMTEFGNVSANFWKTNVFAGGWCGLIMLIHFLLLICTGCCCPGSSSAFRVVVVSFIALVACTVLVGFDAYFLAQPSACLLTSACSSNAASNTTFSYSLQSSFFTTFTGWSAFKSYTETQAKFLFQSMQLGIGVLCVMICVIYLVIYYSTKSQLNGQVQPIQKPSGPSPRQGNYPPPPMPPITSAPAPVPPLPQPQQQQKQFYQPSGPTWRPPAYVPQPPPGQMPWNPNKRY